MKNKIILKSDNDLLESSFEWAEEKIQSFVMTGIRQGTVNKGDGGKWYGPNGITAKSPTYDWAQPRDYIPCFWAGYRDRTAFYIRDFVHQAKGAHYAGLDNEIYSMYKTFIDSACEKNGGWALWSFNFDGSVYYMDTPCASRFVRELTAQYELAALAYNMYLCTGDGRYIYDDKIFSFADNILNNFTAVRDGVVLPRKNGIPEGTGDIWHGSATYNERGFCTAEAGDCIGAMYSALISLLRLRGNDDESTRQLERAKRLKAYFNSDWSVVGGTDKYCYAVDSKGDKHYKWCKKGGELHGGASLVLIPFYSLAEDGKRADKMLEYIHACECDELLREDNIESYTYLPEIFFRYGKSERAWYWMKYIMNRRDLPHERASQGTNGDYPELSFTFVSHTIEGLMGFSANVAEHSVSTFPQLPNGINAIEAQGIPSGDFTVDLSVGKDAVILKNNAAFELSWTAGFRGDFDTLYADGTPLPAHHVGKCGTDYSCVSVKLPPGSTCKISSALT